MDHYYQMEQVEDIQGNLRRQIGERIKQQTHQKFNSLFIQKFNRSYDQSNIYTVVCSIGLVNKQTTEIKILALANGTKSLPYQLYLQNQKYLIEDMHAEILAIKAFRKFISNEINKSHSEYFKDDPKRRKKAFLREKFEIFLYSSESFCGDCSVNQQEGTFSGGKPLKFFESKQLPDKKFQKHILRTKPGRKDLPQHKRSLCLSCSDKLALYNILGIQGKQLFRLTLPIYIDLYIVDCSDIQKQCIQKGLGFIYRISKLSGKNQSLIKRKVFNIIVNGRQRLICHQIRQHKFQIVCVKKINEQNVPQVTNSSKKEQKQGFQVSLIWTEEYFEWINSRTGLPEGSSLNNYMKKGRISGFSPIRLSQSVLKICNMNSQSLSISHSICPQIQQIFKYTAIKDRIKLLFGIWTDDFKNQTSKDLQMPQSLHFSERG